LSGVRVVKYLLEFSTHYTVLSTVLKIEYIQYTPYRQTDEAKKKGKGKGKRKEKERKERKCL